MTGSVDKKVLKVGINGYGRIGRLLHRAIILSKSAQVQVINDPFMKPSDMASLLKYDSVHGVFPYSVEADDHAMVLKVDGVTTIVCQYTNTADIDFSVLKVKVLFEATGIYKTADKIKPFLCPDTKCVVTCPVSSSSGINTYVIGVNHADYAGEDIISCASCTTNCLAHLMKFLDDRYGVVESSMCTVHASTASQKVVDSAASKKSSLKLSKAASANIIPSTTGASEAVGTVLPHLAGKVKGNAYRVPVLDVSVVDLAIKLKNHTNLKTIGEEFSKYRPADSNVVGVAHDNAVSSDFIGDSRSCILDVYASMQLNDTFFKLVAWYDNEFSYACRALDLAHLMADY